MLPVTGVTGVGVTVSEVRGEDTNRYNCAICVICCDGHKVRCGRP